MESGAAVKTGTESEDDSSDCVDTSKSNFRSEGRAIPPGMVTWVGDAIYSIIDLDSYFPTYINFHLRLLHQNAPHLLNQQKLPCP